MQVLVAVASRHGATREIGIDHVVSKRCASIITELTHGVHRCLCLGR